MVALASLVQQVDRGLRLVVPGTKGGVELGSEPLAPLATGLPALDAVLPGGGLPRACVVELSAPHGLARATTIALAACASAQAEARCRGAAATEGAWCAWVDATGTLFAPAAAAADVDLTRLLVVRPPADVGVLARVAVRIAQAGAFAVVVIDTAGVPGRTAGERLDRWATVVRRLSLAVEKSATTVLLVTDARASRPLPLPVAMRIELDRRNTKEITVRIGKDRLGRVTSPSVIDLGRGVGSAIVAPTPSTAAAVVGDERSIDAARLLRAASA
jgi:recombination protein RecA